MLRDPFKFSMAIGLVYATVMVSGLWIVKLYEPL